MALANPTASLNSSLSITTAIEKARISSDVPFLVCLDIETVDPNTGSVVDTGHLVLNNEPITFNGNTYQPAYFDIQFSMEANATPQVSLSMADYTQTAIAYMDQYNGLVGSHVTFTVVNAANLAAGPEVQEFFDVTASSIKDYKVMFQLGAATEVTQVFPRNKQRREFCSNTYKDPLTCGYGQLWMRLYGSDNGTSTPRITQLVPASAVTAGVSFCFSAYAFIPNINRSVRLVVYDVTAATVITSVELRRQSNDKLAKISGKVTWSYSSLGGGIYRIAVYSSTGVTSGHDIQAVLVYANYSGTNLQATDMAAFGGAQLEFGTITPTNYEHTTTTRGTRNVLLDSNISTTLRGGLFSGITLPLISSNWQSTVGTGYPATALTEYSTDDPIPGPNIGTLSSCDLTLQGSNGCAAHGNTINFGGYPSLNSMTYRYA